MSRSNPTDASRNPSTRWFEWAAGDASKNGGVIRYYDKDAKQNVPMPMPFTFLLLDELSTVKGWHDASDSGIYANEVRDTRQETLVVRAFKGGELASGIYTDIRDRVAAKGGYYAASIYIAYRDGAELKIGNLTLDGASAGAWMEFKKAAPSKKSASGKTVKSYFVDAVSIVGYEERKKGATTYRIPKFSLKAVTPETDAQAAALDVELQAFMADYMKRPKIEAASSSARDEETAVSAPAAKVPEQAPPTDEDFSDVPF